MTTKFLSLTLMAGSLSGVAFAQSFTQNFDDITTLGAQGWASANLSTQASTGGPIGSHWWQGNSNPSVNASSSMTAHSGATASFISSDFGATTNTTSAGGTISNWLYAPVVTLNNGDTFSFWTRQGIFGTTTYADRLRLMISTSGSSVNSGDFSAGVTINPTLSSIAYPTTWTQYTYTVTGLAGPTSGRFAFHYDLPNAGLNATNGGRIAIDTVRYQAVPEPATMTALALGAAAAMRRKRRKSA